ncbi:hypothetical protein [Salinifilum ghardaiensis]
MGAVIGVVALLITLAALGVAAGHMGYLAMLNAAAKKRAGGQPAAEFARKRYPMAGLGLGVTAVALLIALGGGAGADIFAILLGGGAGFGSLKALQSSQAKFRRGELN